VRVRDGATERSDRPPPPPTDLTLRLYINGPPTLLYYYSSASPVPPRLSLLSLAFSLPLISPTLSRSPTLPLSHSHPALRSLRSKVYARFHPPISKCARHSAASAQIGRRGGDNKPEKEAPRTQQKQRKRSSSLPCHSAYLVCALQRRFDAVQNLLNHSFCVNLP
jgi:hypothetical protein